MLVIDFGFVLECLVMTGVACKCSRACPIQCLWVSPMTVYIPYMPACEIGLQSYFLSRLQLDAVATVVIGGARLCAATPLLSIALYCIVD